MGEALSRHVLDVQHPAGCRRERIFSLRRFKSRNHLDQRAASTWVRRLFPTSIPSPSSEFSPIISTPNTVSSAEARSASSRNPGPTHFTATSSNSCATRTSTRATTSHPLAASLCRLSRHSTDPGRRHRPAFDPLPSEPSSPTLLFRKVHGPFPQRRSCSTSLFPTIQTVHFQLRLTTRHYTMTRALSGWMARRPGECFLLSTFKTDGGRTVLIRWLREARTFLASTR